MELFKRLFGKKEIQVKKGSSEIIYDANGVKIYGWPQVELIPTKRYLAYVLAANDAELGISRSDLLAYVKGVSDCYENNIHTKVGWYIETIRFYLENYPPEKVAFRMIAPLIRLEGEPEGDIPEEFTKEKARLYEEDLSVRAFFLSYGFDRLSESGLLSPDIEKKDFLNMGPALAEKTFSRLTGNDTYKDYLSK